MESRTSSAALPRLTLDTNLLIAVHQQEPGHESVLALRQLNDVGSVRLRLVAASATDLLNGRQSVTDIPSFNDWLNSIGFSRFEILEPLCVLGYTFYGSALLADDEMARLYQDLGRTLFPDRYSDPQSQPPTRNQICDVMMIWAHLYHRGDAFITNDTVFHQATKKPRLLALGASRILTPAEAIAIYGPRP